MEMTLETKTSEPGSNRPAPQTQPIEALANLDPMLDETAIRQAIAHAEANNLDPQSLTMDDFAKAQGSNPNPDSPAPEVPPKFLKSDGTVDVDKIQASTQALDTAIQKKEEAITKTVEDYMREYNERETKFRTLPNPQRLAAQVPAPLPSPAPAADSPPPNYEDIVRRDWMADPLMTTARLIDLALQQRFQPLEAKEKTENIRLNLQTLAAKDSRVLREDIFAAMNAKLASDPDLWKLKNPHKAAWLEVKEEMRLGEPSSVQAQPSRPLSPVLGGGTPPSVPSASVPSQQNVLANLGALDIRDKKQEALGDEAIRRALMGERG